MGPRAAQPGGSRDELDGGGDEGDLDLDATTSSRGPCSGLWEGNQPRRASPMRLAIAAVTRCDSMWLVVAAA